ncbi:MAG: phosphate acyltransferase PlsX [Pelagibacteraceae bacterium]|nr:phosphate acyltransferase PlsX [Pelagibacteraceae bacterium]
MSHRQITIAIDAMGGEGSPLKCLKGAEIFSNNHQGVMLQFFGDQDLIKQTIKNHKLNITNYKIVKCFDNVTDDDNANTILRSRKNSSISRGLTFIKDNPNSGFISAGNTAALMILSRLILGMIEGVNRPAICSTIPNEKSYSLMMDLGANVHVSADNLLQFALMGNAFFSIIDPKRNPKIGLINIGTENNKGLEFLQDAHDLISSTFLKNNFIGFIEPNKITHGYCDIILSDGYTGNIILKTAEGLSDFITSNLKNVFTKSLVNKIAYKMIEKDLIVFKNQIDPAEYNGATFLGVNGISVKSHGNANPYAFSCAINKCYDFVLNDLNKKIIENFKNYK